MKRSDKPLPQSTPTISQRVDQALSRHQGLEQALQGIMPAESVRTWLKEPKEIFQNRSPLDLIEHGEIDRIFMAIDLLVSGSAY